jgi:hypothetical protein
MMDVSVYLTVYDSLFSASLHLMTLRTRTIKPICYATLRFRRRSRPLAR